EGVFGRERMSRNGVMAAAVMNGPARSYSGFAGSIQMRRPAALPEPALEDRSQQAVRSGYRLDPALLALINKRPAGEPVNVQNGQVAVQLFLADSSAQTLAQLKQLGFEIVLQPKSGKVLVGRIAVEKLTALSQLAAVKY